MKAANRHIFGYAIRKVVRHRTWALLGLSVIVLGLLFSTRQSSHTPSLSSSNKASSSQNDLQQPLFAQMSSDQHLAEAKRLITSTATLQDLQLAGQHLKQVATLDPKNPSVAALNSQAVARLKAIEASTDANETATTGPVLTPADKFALRLQRTLTGNGYDVDVRVDINKTLVLTSDLFKDPDMREQEANELWKERKDLCQLDIWHAKVGYSTGLFSGDIAKSISLGCPAEKADLVNEMAPERVKAAAALSGDGIQASVDGTILVYDSDFFSDQNLRAQFARKLLSDPIVMQKTCALAFSQLVLKYHGKLIQTVPLTCK